MSLDADFRAVSLAQSPKESFADSLAEASRQEGVFNGQAAKEVDVQGSLEDAAEEMTFAASEKVEKKLSERKAGSKEAMRTSAVELAEKYVNMMSEGQNSHKMHEFLDALKKMGAQTSEQEIRDLVRQRFGDDATDQFAALSFAEEALASEGKQEALLDKVRQAKETLLQTAGPAIRAGLNIATDVLAASRSGLGMVSNLREVYQYAILGRASIAEMYAAIMKRYGPGQFQPALDFLLRAAGNDLASQALGPSLEPAHLRTAIDDINHVQNLGNLFRSLSELIDRVRVSYAR